MNDYPRPFTEKLVENFDNLIESAWHFISSDSIVFENTVNFVSDSAAQETLKGCAETVG